MVSKYERWLSIAADGFEDAALTNMKKILTEAGAQVKIVAPRLGMLTSAKGATIGIDFSFLTASSVMFDGLYVLGGEKSVAALMEEDDVLDFVKEAYKHCKTIAASGAGIELLGASDISTDGNGATSDEENPLAVDSGIVISRNAHAGKIATEFIRAIAQQSSLGT